MGSTCQRQKDDMVLLAHMRSQFAVSNGTFSYPRMHVELSEDGLVVGRHRVAKLMRENGLKAHPKHRFNKTTDNHNNCLVAFNILDQNFICDGPDQKSFSAFAAQLPVRQRGC